MHGNVWEWCSDAEAVLLIFSNRVLRGGSWFSDAALCRAAYRNTFVPSDRNGSIGFRLALSSQSGVSSPAEQVQGK
jgi:formylglycine-generating enzyme required for sulfatase activity